MKARDNPFATEKVLAAIRYTDPAGDPGTGLEAAAALVARCEAIGGRAAIVGPHGSGKTTLLEDLASVLARRGLRVVALRLDADRRRLPRTWRRTARQLTAVDVVCLDGAEQLGPLPWLRFRWQARRAGCVLVTTHRPGRLPTLVTCATNAGLLDRITRRLAPHRLPGAPPAEDLFARHRGNLRDALRELYDVYASRGRA